MRTAVKDKMSGETISGDWRGGEYIELSFDARYGAPFDVINVWDHATGAATIPFTRDAMRSAIRDWIGENREDLGGYREMMRGY